MTLCMRKHSKCERRKLDIRLAQAMERNLQILVTLACCICDNLVAAPAARIANNPLFLEDLTPWPVNISWALLSNRSSLLCWPRDGNSFCAAVAPAPLPNRRRVPTCV